MNRYAFFQAHLPGSITLPGRTLAGPPPWWSVDILAGHAALPSAGPLRLLVVTDPRYRYGDSRAPALSRSRAGPIFQVEGSKHPGWASSSLFTSWLVALRLVCRPGPCAHGGQGTGCRDIRRAGSGSRSGWQTRGGQAGKGTISGAAAGGRAGRPRSPTLVQHPAVGLSRLCCNW